MPRKLIEVIKLLYILHIVYFNYITFNVYFLLVKFGEFKIIDVISCLLLTV